MDDLSLLRSTYTHVVRTRGTRVHARALRKNDSPCLSAASLSRALLALPLFIRSFYPSFHDSPSFFFSSFLVACHYAVSRLTGEQYSRQTKGVFRSFKMYFIEIKFHLGKIRQGFVTEIFVDNFNEEISTEKSM